MNIITNNNSIMMGSFSSNQKNSNVGKEEKKNNSLINGNVENSYSKMIENIEEQMKNLQENDYYDAETKKEKMKELQK